MKKSFPDVGFMTGPNENMSEKKIGSSSFCNVVAPLPGSLSLLCRKNLENILSSLGIFSKILWINLTKRDFLKVFFFWPQDFLFISKIGNMGCYWEISRHEINGQIHQKPIQLARSPANVSLIFQEDSSSGPCVILLVVPPPALTLVSFGAWRHTSQRCCTPGTISTARFS